MAVPATAPNIDPTVLTAMVAFALLLLQVPPDVLLLSDVVELRQTLSVPLIADGVRESAPELIGVVPNTCDKADTVILPPPDVVLMALTLRPITLKASTVLLLSPAREITSEEVVNEPTVTVERSPAAEIMENVGAVVVLNCQPAGGDRVILVDAFHTPPVFPKLEDPFSEMVISPNVVAAGVAPSRAVLLHILVPPVPGVTVIWPETATEIKDNSVTINKHCLPNTKFIIGNFLNEVIFFFMFQVFLQIKHKHTDIKCF